MNDQVPEDVEPVLHVVHPPVLDAGEQGVFLHVHPEVVGLQDAPNEGDPLLLPLQVRRAPLELEADVVLGGPLAHQGLQNGEVEPHARAQAAVVPGDHEVVPVGVAGAEPRDQGRVRGGLEHHGGEPAAVHRGRPGPGLGRDALPHGPHGDGDDVLDLHVAPFHLLGEPVVQVQDPPLHGDVADQLLAGPLGEVVVPAETEHLGHGLLVAEPGDVVEGSAVSRPEGGGVGVQQVEGGDEAGGPFQGLVDRASLHEVPGPLPPFQQPLHAPLVHPPGVRVHRHRGAVLDMVQRPLHPEEGRHAELPGHVGQVAGHAPLLGHHGRGPVQDRGPPGQGLGGHEHAVPGESQKLRLLADDAHGPGGRARAGRVPAGEEHGGVLRLDLPPNALRGLLRLLEGPALEEEHGAVGPDRPLHVLGRSVMLLDPEGETGQLHGLLVGEGRSPRLLLGNRLPPEAFRGVGQDLVNLLLDLPADDPRRVPPLQHEEIGGFAPVHHALGKTPGRVDRDPVVVDVHRVAGVGDPADGGLHHGQDAHAHGDVLVPEPAAEPVAHGGQAVLAGHDLPVRLGKVVPAHVELGAVLPGEARSGRVLPQGAASHGHGDAGACGRLEPLVRPGQGLLQVAREGRADDQLLEVGAQRMKPFASLLLRRLDAAVDLGLEVVVTQEALKPVDCDHESRGGVQVKPVGQLSQVGHLAPGHIRGLPVHPVQGEDQGAVRRQMVAPHVGVDLLLDLPEAVEEDLVLRALGSEQVQVSDDLPDAGRGRGQAGADKGHAEGTGSLQGLFQLGHDLQGPVVGVEEELEMVVALPEVPAERLGVLLAWRALFSEKASNGVGEPPHTFVPKTSFLPPGGATSAPPGKMVSDPQSGF